MKYTFLLSTISLFAGLSVTQPIMASEQAQAPHFLLTSQTAPNGLKVLPPPPRYTSVAFLNDQAQYHAGYALKGSKRWQQSLDDSGIDYNKKVIDVTPFVQVFDDAFGQKLTKKQYPAIFRIFQEIQHDVPLTTLSAKDHYNRTRPFVFFHQHACRISDEAFLRKNGSFPSGHAAQGWAAALALTEIKPSRQNQILKKGYTYGQSRVVCGAHWQSDVDAGRLAGAAVLARLQAEPAFRQWIQLARQEVQQAAKL